MTTMLVQCSSGFALCGIKVLAKLFYGDLYLSIIASQFLSYVFSTVEIAEAEPKAKRLNGVPFIVTEKPVGKRSSIRKALKF